MRGWGEMFQMWLYNKTKELLFSVFYYQAWAGGLNIWPVWLSNNILTSHLFWKRRDTSSIFCVMCFGVAYPKKIPTNQQKTIRFLFFLLKHTCCSDLAYSWDMYRQQKQSSPVLFQVDCQVSPVNGKVIADLIRIKLSFTHQLLVIDDSLLLHSRCFFLTPLCVNTALIFSFHFEFKYVLYLHEVKRS